MNDDRFEKALAAVRSDRMSIRQAASIFGICRSTLHDRLKGKRQINEQSKRKGPDPYLANDEEKKIVQWIEDMCKCGFPFKTDDILNTAQKFITDAKRKTPFKNNRPGRSWVRSFKIRNPSLVLREAENLSKGTAAVTNEAILKWFQQLENYLKSIGQEFLMNNPKRVLGGDESSFCLCPITGKVLAPREYKNIHQTSVRKEKDTVTVYSVFSADGTLLEPMVVFPYLDPSKDIIESMPESWFLGRSETGRMRNEIFFEYVVNCVHKHLLAENVQLPVILFVDGHKSHLSFELSEFCSTNGIILYALPPNTTHIMKPADGSVFKHLKAVREWKIKHFGEVLTWKNFCPLLNKAIMNNKDMTATIQNGFRKCGLYPFNSEAVDFSKRVQNNFLADANFIEQRSIELPDEQGYGVSAPRATTAVIKIERMDEIEQNNSTMDTFSVSMSEGLSEDGTKTKSLEPVTVTAGRFHTPGLPQSQNIVPLQSLESNPMGITNEEDFNYESSELENLSQNLTDIKEEFDVSDYDYSEVSSDVTTHNCENITEKLKNWAIQHNISNACLSDLLGILKTCYPDLPIDAQTLLNMSFGSMHNKVYSHSGTSKKDTTLENEDTLQVILRTQTEQKKTINEMQGSLLSLQQNVSEMKLMLQEVLAKKTEVVDDKICDGMECPGRNAIRENLMPISTQEALDDLEEKIRSNPSFKRSFIAQLSTYGGVNPNKTIRTIAKLLFDDKLLMEYSWHGTISKKKFDSYTNIFRAVVEAVRQRFASFSDNEASAFFKTYIKQAPFRKKILDENKNNPATTTDFL